MFLACNAGIVWNGVSSYMRLGYSKIAIVPLNGGAVAIEDLPVVPASAGRVTVASITGSGFGITLRTLLSFAIGRAGSSSVR